MGHYLSEGACVQEPEGRIDEAEVTRGGEVVHPSQDDLGGVGECRHEGVRRPREVLVSQHHLYRNGDPGQ